MKFTFLFFAFLILLNQALADVDIIIFADEAGSPLSYSENGVAKGLYVDIINKAAKQVHGYKIKVLPIPWKRGLNDLELGKSFALLPPYKIHTRDYIDPYSTPILNEEVALFCREDVAAKLKPPYKFPESFINLKIGVNNGYTLGEKFEGAVKSGIVFVDYARNAKANILKMELKRVDCNAAVEYNYFWTLRHIKLEYSKNKMYKFNFLKVSTISQEVGYIGYSKTFNAPYKQDFVKKMNQAIEQLKLSGEVEKISEKYREH